MSILAIAREHLAHCIEEVEQARKDVERAEQEVALQRGYLADAEADEAAARASIALLEGTP